MGINLDKPHLWKNDIAKSVDQFNEWFVNFAPRAYRDTRVDTTKHVESAMGITDAFVCIDAATLKANPEILPTLRMATAPPIARDRLAGLAYTSRNLVKRLESGELPTKLDGSKLNEHLKRICEVIVDMLDNEIFPWLSSQGDPDPVERHRAATIVADRLCGAVADPIVRNAQEKRQLAYMKTYLEGKDYSEYTGSAPIEGMPPGTFAFRKIALGGSKRNVNIPVDLAIQPQTPFANGIPLLVEAKSAGDFTNTNKRRKEEATKINQLRASYGNDVRFILFLCGYFGAGYLGYEAAEGIDWVWEHRIEDIDQAGI